MIWNPERAVQEANLAFYEAFAARSFEAMAQLWSIDERVSCIHPGWQPVYGRERVLASWRSILAAEPTNIRCDDPRVFMTDEVGIVTCLERLSDGRLAASNVFILEEGLWKMVHHQAAPFVERPLPSDDIPPPDSLN